MSALKSTRERGSLAIPLAVLVLLLAGLPLAVWLDMQNITAARLQNQARDLSSLITSIRGYYASNVVGPAYWRGTAITPR